MPRLPLSALLPVCLLTLTPTFDARGVVNVSVSSPVVVNVEATVTVTWTAPCGAITVNFGDGNSVTKPIDSSNVVPLKVTHAWTTTGSKTVTATGEAGCTGRETETINVVSRTNPTGSLADLCKVIDCGGLADLITPKITGILSVSKPGGAGYIKGKNFGTVKNKVVVNLERFDGVAQPVNLEIINWTATAIDVVWPSDISGVLDQNTTVQVVKANQVKSNEWPITFMAARTTKTLPYDDLKHIDCGIDSNVDVCGTWYDPDDFDGVYDAAPWPTKCVGTICGSHENAWGAIGDDAGTDAFVLPSLKNGWQYSGTDKLKWNTSGGWLGALQGFQPGSSDSPVLSVKWSVTPNDDVVFDIAVIIGGPVGVPHK